GCRRVDREDLWHRYTRGARRIGSVPQALGTLPRRLAHGARRTRGGAASRRKSERRRFLSRQDRDGALLRRQSPAANGRARARGAERGRERARSGRRAVLIPDAKRAFTPEPGSLKLILGGAGRARLA